jgi:hypothetical protein
MIRIRSILVLSACLPAFLLAFGQAADSNSNAVPPGFSPAAISPAPTSATPAAATPFVVAARAVTLSILNNFSIPRTGLYAKSLTDRSPDFMWTDGIWFSALVGAARHDPQTFRAPMDEFFAGLDRYWDKNGVPPGYEPAPIRNGRAPNDKYYDDNAWMVLTFMEAYQLTHEQKYLDRAQATLAFVLSGWDDKIGGGIWWHEKHKDDAKNTCVNAPAAVGCIAVARFRDTAADIDWAKRIVAWTTGHLQDSDGLFFDHQKVSTGNIVRGKLTYNTALMIRANLGLYRATGQAQYLAEARRIDHAAAFFMDRRTGSYRDSVKWSHLLVEADLDLYRVTGDAQALDRARKTGRVYYDRWLRNPPNDLISQASIARMLWLLADVDTPAGKDFWKQADKFPAKRG